LAAALIAGPPFAAAANNCCFELAVDGRQTASLDYGSDLPQPYHGKYSLQRYWSIRSIVGFREGELTHRAALVEKSSEVMLRTTEVSSLADRHARFENGTYLYPYEPIPCGSNTLPERAALQGFASTLTPASDAVSMPKEGNGYRLKLDLGQAFYSQKPVCGGSSDLALHSKEEADSAVTQVRAPRRKFLQIASSGDHKSRDFSSSFSITHGGVAGVHTFENQRELTVSLRWFSPEKLASERNRLQNIECDHLICEEDDWGK
jgi:hypothetical protein